MKDKVQLQVGDIFQQAWKGCTQPMWFKVLDVNRDADSLKVECHSYNGYTYIEIWDDLTLTELSFSIGEYKMIA